MCFHYNPSAHEPFPQRYWIENVRSAIANSFRSLITFAPKRARQIWLLVLFFLFFAALQSFCVIKYMRFKQTVHHVSNVLDREGYCLSEIKKYFIVWCQKGLGAPWAMNPWAYEAVGSWHHFAYQKNNQIIRICYHSTLGGLTLRTQVPIILKWKTRIWLSWFLFLKWIHAPMYSHSWKNFFTLQGVFELIFLDFRHSSRDNSVTSQGVFDLILKDFWHT